MTHDERVIKRDFYFEREVTRKDKVKFMGITLISNAMTYYVIVLVTALLAVMQGTALHVLLQVLTLIPISIILPWMMTTRSVRHIVSRFYSLADDVGDWHKKAISIVVLGEAVRFFVGLLPTTITIYGLVTSPVTYLVYSLVYLTPAGRYDAVLSGGANFWDTAVFLLIYLLYFAVYEFLFMRKFKKEVERNKKYLEGVLEERKKVDDMYKNRKNY